MPELPEVETIRHQMEKHLVGAAVTDVSILRGDMFRGDQTKLVGTKVTRIRRFGKLLVIDFSSDHSIAAHLKMTGRFTLLDSTDSPPQHTHIVFSLEGNKKLTFSDYRRFGYVQVVPTLSLPSFPFLASLGPEPLKDLTVNRFIAICKNSSRPIKLLLLDQTRIAGIGNIYACEALWMAQIHPQQNANRLTQKQFKIVFRAIETVLKEGIAKGGASDNAYKDLFGHIGNYQNFFKVYAREGEPCRRCGTVIEKIIVGGRGTYLCPNCQKQVVIEPDSLFS